MGCTNSKTDDTVFGYGPVVLPKLMTGAGSLQAPGAAPILTPTQQHLIRTTWALMEADLPVIAKQLFLCIFDQDPRVKNLFPFGDVWGDELIHHPQFIAHTLRFMAVIKGAVHSVACLDEGFGPAMISLGARHTKIGGFTPELFQLFKSSMVVIWGQHLRNEMTPEINEAWLLLLDYIVRRLQQGYFGQAKMDEIVNNATTTTTTTDYMTTTTTTPTTTTKSIKGKGE